MFRDQPTESKEERIVGLSGGTGDPIGQTIAKFDSIFRSIHNMNADTTVYIAAKCRTSLPEEDQCSKENTVVAALCCAVLILLEGKPLLYSEKSTSKMNMKHK